MHRTTHKTRAALLLAASAGLAVFAATRARADGGQIAPAASLNDVIGNIRTWLVGVLTVLATTFLTIGGVRYLIAGGDPGGVEKAKTAMRSAAVGYGLAVLAPVVVTVLQTIVGPKK
jgi:hypothetical protein